MCLDHDFVRILLAKIKAVQWDGGYHDLSIKGRPDRMMSRYIMLLDEAGLIEAVNYSTQGMMCWRAKWITEAGEQFLRAAKDQKCWDKAKKIVRHSHRKFTVEALKSALQRSQTAVPRK